MTRRGAALPLALLALIVLGALAAAALNAARLRWLGGNREYLGAGARILAEAAVEQDVHRWNSLLADTLSIGSASPGSAAAGQVTDSIFRLGRALFLVHAVADRRSADGRLLARNGAARLVELGAPRIPLGAAVTAPGPVNIEAGAVVTGDDEIPAGWAPRCPAGDSLNVAVRFDSAGVYNRLAPVSAGQLLDWADFRIEGNATPMGPRLSPDGGCASAEPDNWGDPETPSAPCYGWFPLIGAGADTRITSGRGQALLVAPNGLELAGGARFYGVVLAGGPVVLRDQAVVVGAVFSDSGVTLVDQARIERSNCAARLAIAAAARDFRSLPRRQLRWP